MIQHRIPRWMVAVLALVIVIGVASASRGAGWTEGYTMGLLAAGADSARLTPYLVYQTGHGFPGWGVGGFFGGLFHIGFVIFFLAIFFGFWRRHMTGDKHGGPWTGHGWWHDESHASGPSETRNVASPSSGGPTIV